MSFNTNNTATLEITRFDTSKVKSFSSHNEATPVSYKEIIPDYDTNKDKLSVRRKFQSKYIFTAEVGKDIAKDLRSFLPDGIKKAQETFLEVEKNLFVGSVKVNGKNNLICLDLSQIKIDSTKKTITPEKPETKDLKDSK